MSFTCAIQMTGLVRGESKGKHRSNGKAILAEMGKERVSASETLNPQRTDLNVYEQENRSGFSVWDDMEKRANEYKQAVKGKTKSGEEITRYKSLRKDAVIGVAIIINPPYEECFNWSEEKYQKFYEDTKECLAKFKPEIFRKSNQVFGVEHRDEGYDDNDKHAHAVYDAIAENGRYCGNELDAKFLSDFNKVYPEMMRSKGWEMDDLSTTDWDKYKSDSDYKKERDTKRRTQGKSVNHHMKKKAAENFKKSEEILEDSKQVQEDFNGIKEKLVEGKEAIAMQKELIGQYKAWLDKNEPVIQNLKASKETLETDIKTLKTKKATLDTEVTTKLSKADEAAEGIKENAKKEAKAAADEILENARQKALNALAEEREKLEEEQADQKEKETKLKEKERLLLERENILKGREAKVQQKEKDISEKHEKAKELLEDAQILNDGFVKYFKSKAPKAVAFIDKVVEDYEKRQVRQNLFSQNADILQAQLRSKSQQRSNDSLPFPQ